MAPALSSVTRLCDPVVHRCRAALNGAAADTGAKRRGGCNRGYVEANARAFRRKPARVDCSGRRVWARTMMEGHVVGGAAGVTFVVALVSAASAVMWVSKGARMMARIARHDGGSLPRVSWRKELSEARDDLVKPVIYFAACVLLAVMLATLPGGGVSRAWGVAALLAMGADGLLCEIGRAHV